MTDTGASSKNVRRIALYGLSADPPTGHGGHVGIVQALVNMPLFDEVHILPVYRHTYQV
jgi:nicotinic acid mononucleotide adenylyltransferase